MPYKHFFKGSKRFHQFTALIVVLIVITIGSYLLTGSHAATPYVSATTDSGTLTGNATKQPCSGALDGNCVIFAAPSTGGNYYSGKLLGLNSSLDDLSELNNQKAWQQLNVNTVRGDVELDTSTNPASFDAVSYAGSSATWIDAVTAQHIVPLPLLNQYIEISQMNLTSFTNATVTWCHTYCAGGSFYKNNSSADGTYAPQVLEILNEPNWGASYGYPVTATDVNDYGTLLKDVRAALNSAGLNNIGILATANNNSGGFAGWDTDLVSDGGFAASQGIAVHPYGTVDTSCPTSSSTTGCTVTSGDTSGTNTSGLGVAYWAHQFLVNNGLSANANVYITEDGWCNTSITDPGCTGGQYSELQKDQNISAIIDALSTTSWFKGFWYFNLIPYQDCYQGQCADNTYGFVTPYPALVENPAWNVFAQNAQAVGL